MAEKFKDLNDMIEILHLAIVREETEEQFFLRSAAASTSESARTLFSEIAEELGLYLNSLRSRKQKLEEALASLEEEDIVKESGIARDPVCSMEINEKTCNFVTTYNGKEYRFCSEDCMKAFELSPEKYLKQ